MDDNRYRVEPGAYINECGERVEVDENSRGALKGKAIYEILFQTPHGAFGPRITMRSIDSDDPGQILHMDLVERVGN